MTLENAKKIGDLVKTLDAYKRSLKQLDNPEHFGVVPAFRSQSMSMSTNSLYEMDLPGLRKEFRAMLRDLVEKKITELETQIHELPDHHQ